MKCVSYAPTNRRKCKTCRETIGTLTKYYSYDTVVAFEYEGKLYVHKNNWGSTTGKHLNWIDGGSDEARRNRKDKEHFERLLDAAEMASALDYVTQSVRP